MMFIDPFYSHCNRSHTERLNDFQKNRVETYLPDLFTSYTICAGYEGSGGGSCKGDSGSPIFVFVSKNPPLRYQQIGIVSGEIGLCGSGQFPGVYTFLEHPEIFQYISNFINNGRCQNRHISMYCNVIH